MPTVAVLWEIWYTERMSIETPKVPPLEKPEEGPITESGLQSEARKEKSVTERIVQIEGEERAARRLRDVSRADALARERADLIARRNESLRKVQGK